jgi:hypothetical protein
MSRSRDESTYFDREWRTDQPLIAELDESLSMPVTFAIDANYHVHEYEFGRSPFSCLPAVAGHLRAPDGAGEAPDSAVMARRALSRRRAESRRIIVRAIALHLERERAAERVRRVGDWVEIPAIVCPGGRDPDRLPWGREKDEPKDDRYLAELMGSCSDPERALDIRKLRLNEKGKKRLLDFGIRLWNDDVIKPEILLRVALKGYRVTRAAAMRCMHERRACIAGESWTQKEWKSVRENTRQRTETHTGGRPEDSAV